MFNFFSSRSRCKAGTHRSGDRCVRVNFKTQRERDLPKESCKLDGKTFCKRGDVSLRPLIARAGGKSQLADKIISKMDKHDVYNEPFIGGGAVFLKKPLAKKNYINDKDKDIIKVYKSFKLGQGFDRCDQKGSKNKFDRIAKKSSKSACDLAYVSKWSFGSDLKAKRYVLDGDKSKKLKQYGNRFRPKDKTFGIKYQQAHKDDYKEKLKNTLITAQDFKKVMKKADSSKTVHFLDPPYFGQDKMYKERGVTPKEVCDTAKKMKGQVIITYNDHKEVRKGCKGLKMRKISSRYTLGADSKNKKSKELLITN